jgi:hypothetical protein
MTGNSPSASIPRGEPQAQSTMELPIRPRIIDVSPSRRAAPGGRTSETTENLISFDDDREEEASYSPALDYARLRDRTSWPVEPRGHVATRMRVIPPPLRIRPRASENTAERGISDEDRERIREVRRVGGFYKPWDYKYIAADDNHQRGKTPDSPSPMASSQREMTSYYPQPMAPGRMDANPIGHSLSRASLAARPMRYHRNIDEYSMTPETSTMSEVYSMMPASPTMSEASDSMTAKDKTFANLIETTKAVRGDNSRLIKSIQRAVDDERIPGDALMFEDMYERLAWINQDLQDIIDALKKADEKLDKLVGTNSKV